MTAATKPRVEATDLGSYSQAVLNILEDLSAERDLLQSSQRAMLNILEDAADSTGRLTQVQPAMLNILDDLSVERDVMRENQRAMLNILDDFSDERLVLENSQGAILNVLDDAAESAATLKDIQPAMLNILEDLEGEKATVLALASDLERRVSERTEELRLTNRNLEAFTYSIAHDLRAPLRAMSGFSEALIDDFGDRLDDTGQDYARRIRDASRRMAELIDELLELSKVSRLDLHRERVDMTSMAHAVVAGLRSHDPTRVVEVVIEPEMVGWADRNLIKTVLENLLGNAWKFSAKSMPGRIEMGSLRVDGQPGWFVRDNGVGFDPAFMDRLFKPFQRLHSVADFAGNGVGLASVSRIVERHGGRVWAEGTVGRGAKFSFTIEAEEGH